LLQGVAVPITTFEQIDLEAPMADLPLSVWMTRVECADFFGEN